MRFASLSKILIIFITLPLIALPLISCVHPISEETRNEIDPKTTFAMVSEDPSTFLDQHLILGGVVIALEGDEEGSVLEVMEWQLNRWGEPLYLDDSGRRFLIKTTEQLDPAVYEPGTLVTMAGVVLGHETRLLGEHEYDYPVFYMAEIHLWESPFRYGVHRNIDPAYPYYVGKDGDMRRNPYNTEYIVYPYTQYWYRNSGFYR